MIIFVCLSRLDARALVQYMDPQQLNVATAELVKYEYNSIIILYSPVILCTVPVFHFNRDELLCNFIIKMLFII